MRAVVVALALLACSAAGDRADVDQILEELASVRERAGQLEALVRARRLQEAGAPAEAIVLEEAPARIAADEEACAEPSEDTRCEDKYADFPIMKAICTANRAIFHTAMGTGLINRIAFGVALATYLLVGCAGDIFYFTWKHGPTIVNFTRGVFVANFFFLCDLPEPFVDHPTWCSYLTIFFCFVVHHLVNKVDSVRAKVKDWRKSEMSFIETGRQETPMGTMLPTYKSPGDYSVGSKYMELSYPISYVFCYFFVQVSLIVLYTAHVLGLKDKFFNTNEMRSQNVDMSFWFYSLLLCLIAGHDNLGGRYNCFFWEEIKEVSEKPMFKGKKKYWFGILPVTFWVEWMIRRFMSFFVNGLCRACILGTAPILMSTADPLSVIKDSMAVFFITTLDDLPDAKSLIEEIVITYSAAYPDDPGCTELMNKVMGQARRASNTSNNVPES